MLQVTMITAALLALVNIWIGMRVGQVRMRDKVSLGDAGNPSVLARMRAHSNFNEYVPLIVILMGLVEMAGGARTPLIAAGAVLLIARIAHPLGRSEEHTSELQSLMRISYDVFCLKKTKHLLLYDDETD